MSEFTDDEVRHKKKSKKKTPKKSDHKHEYELVGNKDWIIKGWYFAIERCKICGREKEELHTNREG
jgi:hypothetical protein